jgi:PAS domain S-box-containing protein
MDDDQKTRVRPSEGLPEGIEPLTAYQSQMDQTLKLSEERFSKIFQSNTDLMAISTVEEGRFIDVNESFLETLGYKREDIIGKTSLELNMFVDPHQRDLLKQAALQNGYVRDFEIDYKTKSGEIKSGLFSVNHIETGGEACWLAVLHDITAFKRAEEALLTEKQLTEEYINSLPGLFYVMDEQRLVRWNSAWHSITGYTNEDLADMYGADFFAGKDKELITERVQKVFREGSAEVEAELVTKDGRRIPYFFSGSRREFNGKIHLIGLGIDISERKRLEEEKLAFERQLQAQKLESLSVLAGGIAHDFNNLLVGILGNAELALMVMDPNSPARQIVENMIEASKRAAELVRQMLAYSGKGKFIVEHLDLGKLVEEMTPLLNSMISKKAIVNFDLADNLPLIEADVSQMRQVIINLIVNASEAIGDNRGVISISTGLLECTRNYLDEIYLDKDLREGRYSYLEISDTGCGMDQETVARIFDPFYTTKFTGRGLGLAAVLGIVRGHHGAIKVTSRQSQGTTFRILFPALEGKPIPQVISTKDLTTISLEGKTVMLVDDQETVRSVAELMLRMMGITVVVAEDGQQAIEIFKKEPGKFDCILLDLTMPYLDGDETFQIMRRIRPDICVLLSSGYNKQDLINRFRGRGLAGFVQKPYQSKQLEIALLDALAKNHNPS